MTNKFNLKDRVFFYKAPMTDTKNKENYNMCYANELSIAEGEDKKPFVVVEVCYHKAMSLDGVHKYYKYTLMNPTLSDYEMGKYIYDVSEHFIYNSYEDMDDYVNSITD